MNNMNFNSAPGKSGRNALMGALATVGILGKGKKDGLSARDQAAIMDRKHAQDIEKMAFGHTFGEKSASAAGSRQTRADNRKHKNAKDMVTHSETEKRGTVSHTENEKRGSMSHASDLLHSADQNRFSSVNLSSGSASFRAAPSNPNKQDNPKSTQFNTETPPVNLDNL